MLYKTGKVILGLNCVETFKSDREIKTFQYLLYFIIQQEKHLLNIIFCTLALMAIQYLYFIIYQAGSIF